MYGLPRLGFLSAFALVAAGCASGAPSPSPAPGPSPSTGGVYSAPGTPAPVTNLAWPIHTREHVDLWLHSYALLGPDTTLVPYFERGYRERLLTLRRQRGVTTQLDANRDRLMQRIAVNPSLYTNPQFLPLYFESWDQMRQAMDVFLRANGNPNASNDPMVRQGIAIFAASFPTAPDREWLKLFAEGVDDESRKFYHDYWVGEARSHERVVQHADSLWQRSWRPALQRFLNNTQQQNGELYLSLPLGGEGRTVKYGKVQNAIAVTMPDGLSSTESALYVSAHEMVGSVASAAIEDNTTPAERRAGNTARYEQAAAVRAGALLLERTIPAAVPGYMRFYLQQAGRSAPTDPRVAFAQAFALPTAVVDAIGRQLDVIMGGI